MDLHTLLLVRQFVDKKMSNINIELGLVDRRCNPRYCAYLEGEHGTCLALSAFLNDEIEKAEERKG